MSAWRTEVGAATLAPVRNGKGLLLGLIVLASTIACTSADQVAVAQEQLQAGLDAAGAGDRASAVSHYQECVRLDPQNKFCVYNLGVHAGIDGRIDESEAFYRQALEIDPDFPEPIYNLAIIYRDRGDRQSAVDYFHRYITLVPNDADGHLSLGLLLRGMGQTDEANRELAEAQRLNPNTVIPSPSP